MCVAKEGLENRYTCPSPLPAFLIVQSPFRAKHHVVVQYMAARLKCPPPPPPCQTPSPHKTPLPLLEADPPLLEVGHPPLADSMTGGRQGG